MTMRDVVIRNLDEAAIQRLERRAAANGWSLEEEIGFLLTEGIERMEQLMGDWKAFGKKLEALSGREVLQRQLISNCRREGLQPAERVKAIAALMQATGWNGAETAKRLGLSKGQVSKCSTLAGAPAWVLELLAGGQINLGVAYLIASEADVAKQAELRDAALNGASRDALAGRKKRERQPAGTGKGKQVRRITPALPAEKTGGAERSEGHRQRD
jgi:plasmid stability protein